MAKSILFVESRPAGSGRAEEYHAWHDRTHIPEMLKVDGFLSARRFRAADGETFITIYEIDTDIETAKANLASAQESGQMSKPVGVELSPPPAVRYFSLIEQAD